jgi:hypothetical protein
VDANAVPKEFPTVALFSRSAGQPGEFSKLNLNSPTIVRLDAHVFVFKVDANCTRTRRRTDALKFAAPCEPLSRSSDN